MYVALPDLELGVHQVRVAVVPTGPEASSIEGLLFVTIREPVARALTGAYREALLVRTNPALPTLEEVWEGRAAIEIVGPPGVMVDTRVVLRGADGAVLVAKDLAAAELPVTSGTWGALFDREFRSLSEVNTHYDEATALIVQASHDEVGSATLECERPFAPLRWSVGRDGRGPIGRLHDNAGFAAITLRRFDFSQPTSQVPVTLEPGLTTRWDKGGLFVARGADFEAAVVLPPLVGGWDDLERLGSSPTVRLPQRDPAGIAELITSHRLWARASLPGDPFAQVQRDNVMRSITVAICGLLGGKNWQRAERDGPATEQELGDALGDKPYHSDLRLALDGQLARMAESAMDERVAEFARILKVIRELRAIAGREVWVAEWVLRLASSPADAADWLGDELSAAIKVALESPTIVRAARYVVLAVEMEQGDSKGLFGQWGWGWP